MTPSSSKCQRDISPPKTREVVVAAVTPSPAAQKSKKRKRRRTASASSSNCATDGTRTQSFQALWSGTLDLHGFEGEKTIIIEPHTLILGTHPSVSSLQQQQYYAHPMNAFWWIAGDCLGFRRGTAVSPSTGKPYKFASELRFGMERIVPYHDQIRILVQNGFCLWDVVQSCIRPGSLDADIKQEVPNDIRGFCLAHPSIRRIVLANGGTGCALFAKHFQDWWKSGQLQAGTDAPSQLAFGKYSSQKKTNHSRSKKVHDDLGELQVITCICAVSVSPAAAKHSYEYKRDFWELNIYQPGLHDKVVAMKVAETNLL